MWRGVWVRCVLAVMTVLVAPTVALLIVLVPRWSDLLVHGGRLWSRTLLLACGARVRVHGREHLSEHAPCIFIANHQSMVDIWALLTVVPPNTRFVAKQELFRIPLFGWALSASGCVPIDRANHADALRALSRAAERIRAGCSVVLFPEGSRSRDGRLGPFKKGAFHLALQAGVPVVPVAITGSFEVMPPDALLVRPGAVEVYVEPAVAVGPFLPADHEALRDHVHRLIARRFERAPPAAGEPDALEGRP